MTRSWQSVSLSNTIFIVYMLSESIFDSVCRLLVARPSIGSLTTTNPSARHGGGCCHVQAARERCVARGVHWFIVALLAGCGTHYDRSFYKALSHSYAHWGAIQRTGVAAEPKYVQMRTKARSNAIAEVRCLRISYICFCVLMCA